MFSGKCDLCIIWLYNSKNAHERAHKRGRAQKPGLDCRCSLLGRSVRVTRRGIKLKNQLRYRISTKVASWRKVSTLRSSCCA